MPRIGSRSSSARPRLVALGTVVALACGGLLTGCASQDATPLASRACAHVESALAAEHKAASAGPVQAAQLGSEALDQVRAALPFAAQAAGDGHDMAAAGRHLERVQPGAGALLLPALAAQCAGVARIGLRYVARSGPPADLTAQRSAAPRA